MGDIGSGWVDGGILIVDGGILIVDGWMGGY